MQRLIREKEIGDLVLQGLRQCSTAGVTPNHIEVVSCAPPPNLYRLTVLEIVQGTHLKLKLKLKLFSQHYQDLHVKFLNFEGCDGILSSENLKAGDCTDINLRKFLKQREANKCKMSRQQETIKPRAEINQVKTKRTIQRNSLF